MNEYENEFGGRDRFYLFIYFCKLYNLQIYYALKLSKPKRLINGKIGRTFPHVWILLDT